MLVDKHFMWCSRCVTLDKVIVKPPWVGLWRIEISRHHSSRVITDSVISAGKCLKCFNMRLNSPSSNLSTKEEEEEKDSFSSTFFRIWTTADVVVDVKPAFIVEASLSSSHSYFMHMYMLKLWQDLWFVFESWESSSFCASIDNQ